MKLSEFAADKGKLTKQLRSARAAFLKDVRVNDGIRGSQDVVFILDNATTEPVDWTPLYQYAEQFD